jgi:hypothetical protein
MKKFAKLEIEVISSVLVLMQKIDQQRGDSRWTYENAVQNLRKAKAQEARKHKKVRDKGSLLVAESNEQSRRRSEGEPLGRKSRIHAANRLKRLDNECAKARKDWEASKAGLAKSKRQCAQAQIAYEKAQVKAEAIVSLRGSAIQEIIRVASTAGVC